MHISQLSFPFDGAIAVLVAAEHGSFSRAAEALALTHGSVSRRVATLERWLGTAIFDRQGRGVRLTPAGQRFVNEAGRAIDALTSSTEQWRPRAGRQTVRLSVVPSFARLWLLPRLAALEGDDLRIELDVDHRPNDLSTREADLAIRYGTGSWEGLDARLLFTETLVPASTPDLAGTARTALAKKLLPDLALIHDSDVTQWRAWLREDALRYSPRWQDRRFEDYDSVLAAAGAGLGIALLRLPLARPLVDNGVLVAVSDRAIPNPRRHYICMHEGESRPSVLLLAERLLAMKDDGHTAKRAATARATGDKG